MSLALGNAHIQNHSQVQRPVINENDVTHFGLRFLPFQFTQWVDAVIFVFSLENEVSFQSVYTYYAKMAHFRNTAEIPLILVGTQGRCMLRF